MNLVARARRFLALHANVPRYAPVIVYQMAKVGSSAIVDALERHRLPVFHVHRMNPEHLLHLREERRRFGWDVRLVPPHDELGMQLYRNVVRRGRRAKVVTIVREPIARNLSSYFEHLDAIWNTKNAHQSIPVEDLCRGLPERFPHTEPLTWFEDEMLPVLGIDVYSSPFPEEGHDVIRTKHVDVLILKCEISDETKSAALSRFLGIDGIDVRRTNETASKEKGAVFQRFRQTIRLSPSYIEDMLSARYTRHFYSEAERWRLTDLYLKESDHAGTSPHL
jgi:hypothetical protein